MNGEASFPLLNKIFDSVNKVGDSIVRICKKIQRGAGRIPEITASLLYVILHIVISCFHEPGFDEAVAWQIAKCASIKDILFVRPHYEGHPPLWHLILLPFAKLGCPYEFSMSLVSLLFAGAAVLLIIWKSPFPRIVRLLLPFTYFFFYQYGIVSRPYCVMMLAFVLAALTFKDKDKKPWRFILSLMLLCLSSAYGILFAGGITIAWLLGLLKKDGLRFLLDIKRTFALFCLLVLAVLLILEIIPASDTYAVINDKLIPHSSGLFLRLVYSFLAMPSDACITNFYSQTAKLSAIGLNDISLLPAVITGICIWACSIYLARKKGTLLTLLIPYPFFAAFTAIKYCSEHHVGIALLFFVFWAWCTCSQDDVCKEVKHKSFEHLLYSVIRIAGVLFMSVSLYWSVMASVHELTYVYGVGRNEAKYIADNGLDKYNIMIGYQIYYVYDENGKKTNEPLAYDFNYCSWGDGVLAYFDSNIFFNLNDGKDDMAFSTHQYADEKDCAELIEKWRAQGAPDVIFMPCDFSYVYYGITNMNDYIPVYFSDIRIILKDSSTDTFSIIYVRSDLVDELGLERVTKQ